jgi:hypothetical protein
MLAFCSVFIALFRFCAFAVRTFRNYSSAILPRGWDKGGLTVFVRMAVNNYEMRRNSSRRRLCVSSCRAAGFPLILGLSLADVDNLLNAICARGEEWPLTHNWEPILHDPDDEPIAQLAQESGARLIITHNTRHLQPAAALGIQVLKPMEFLVILKPSK